MIVLNSLHLKFKSIMKIEINDENRRFDRHMNYESYEYQLKSSKRESESLVSTQLISASHDIESTISLIGSYE